MANKITAAKIAAASLSSTLKLSIQTSASSSTDSCSSALVCVESVAARGSLCPGCSAFSHHSMPACRRISTFGRSPHVVPCHCSVWSWNSMKCGALSLARTINNGSGSPSRPRADRWSPSMSALVPGKAPGTCGRESRNRSGGGPALTPTLGKPIEASCQRPGTKSARRAQAALI